jgi:hypothetical protein
MLHAARRAPLPNRLVWSRVFLGAVAVVCALGATGCSGGGDDSASPTTTVAPGTRLELPLGTVTADSAGAPVSVTPEQSQRILDALTTYVKAATVQPLRSGKPATADFAGVFDPATLGTATTSDRGVVLDEGLPRVTGDLDVEAQPVTVTALGDQSGNLALAAVKLVEDVKGGTEAKGGPLHIARQADLVLQPTADGTWRVTAYSMTVTREGAGVSPTTTSTTGARQ